MLASLLLLLFTQIPCTPGETSVVCSCKAGMLSACETLSLSDSAQAAEIVAELEVAAQAAAMAQGAQRAVESLQDEAQSSPASPEPPDCKGQLHHVISRPIAKALEEHRTLKGQYKPRDPRFVTRAVDEKAHCGYQEWHRKVDEEVIKWLDDNRTATPKQFEALLRQIYKRPDMVKRFPHGF